MDMLLKGLEYQRKALYFNAIECYRKVDKNSTEYSIAVLSEGKCLMLAKDFKSAIKKFILLLKLFKSGGIKKSNIIRLLQYCYFMDRQYNKALIYTKALYAYDSQKYNFKQLIKLLEDILNSNEH